MLSTNPVSGSVSSPPLEFLIVTVPSSLVIPPISSGLTLVREPSAFSSVRIDLAISTILYPSSVITGSLSVGVTVGVAVTCGCRTVSEPVPFS